MYKTRSPMQIQLSVVIALFLRELKTRFGRHTIGYFWPILEPMSHVLVLSLIFSFRGSEHSSGLTFVTLFISGIIPYLMFSSIASRAINAIEANRGLFNYRQVKPIDTHYARTGLEVIIHAILLLLALIVVYIIGHDYSFNSLISTLFYLTILILTSFALGLIFMCIAGLFPESKKILGVLLKPLYFISGIFFSAADIPEQYRETLLLNPIFNLIELIRESIFLDISTSYGDSYYAIMAMLILLITSLSLYKLTQRQLIST